MECAKCDGLTANDCTTCKTTGSLLYYYSHQCLALCPDGYYQNSSDNNICTSCDSTCATCNGFTPSDCLTCKTSGSYLYYYSQQCLTACPSKYHQDATDSNKCRACHGNCLNCDGFTSSNCVSCDQSTTLKYLDGGECLSLCPTHSYQDAADSNHCRTCDSTCLDCNGFGATDCLNCTSPSSNEYFLGNTCLLSCPVDGYYSDSNKNCQDCDAKCKRCQDNSTHCLECKTPGSLQYFLNFDCLAECPEGFYPDAQKKCYPCDGNCLNCTGPSATECVSCKQTASNKYYLNHECLPSCPGGYSIDLQNRCQNCHANCETCNGTTQTDCETCYQTGTLLYLYNSECLPSCPNESFYFLSDNKCKACDPLCRQCEGSTSSDCLRCYESGSNPFLLNKQCLTSCPLIGYYFDANKFCQGCDSTCETCTGSAANCQSCVQASSEKYFYSNQCLTGCPSGYYYNSTNHCLPCDSTCLECTGALPSECSSCKSTGSNQYLLSG